MTEILRCRSRRLFRNMVVFLKEHPVGVRTAMSYMSIQMMFEKTGTDRYLLTSRPFDGVFLIDAQAYLFVDWELEWKRDQKKGKL